MLRLTSTSSPCRDVIAAYTAEFNQLPPKRRANYARYIRPGDLFAFLGDEGRTDDIAVYYVADSGRVGFAEFGELFRHSMPVDGNYSLMIQPQVVLWRGISRELGEFVLRLLKENRLVLEVTISPWTHDGDLGLRRAIYPLKRQYRTLRHLGVAFYLPNDARPEHVLDPASISLMEAA